MTRRAGVSGFSLLCSGHERALFQCRSRKSQTRRATKAAVGLVLSMSLQSKPPSVSPRPSSQAAVSRRFPGGPNATRRSISQLCLYYYLACVYYGCMRIVHHCVVSDATHIENMRLFLHISSRRDDAHTARCWDSGVPEALHSCCSPAAARPRCFRCDIVSSNNLL